MATLNELIAQLNASTGNILSDASRLNTTADNMNQTLDGMGVQEISGIAELAPGRTVGEQRDAGMYDSGQLQYTDVLPQDYGYVGSGAQLPEQGIMSQIKNAVMDYVKSGGILGIGANILGGLLPKESSTNKFLLDTYGGYGPYGRQDKFGYNVVSAMDNYMQPGSSSYRSAQLEALRGLDQNLANQFYMDNYGKTYDQVYKDAQKKTDPFSQDIDVGSGADYYGGNDNNTGGSYDGAASASDYADDPTSYSGSF
jgi:hypothetical protein